MEQPVVRSRGRPRKRRKEDEKEGPEAKRQALAAKPIALVGRYVLKKFPRNGVFLGKVVYYECGLYRLNYEDGDFEDLDSSEIRSILIRDGDFNEDLAKRKVKLEKLVLQNSAKAANVSGKDSAEARKVESAVDVPVPSELNGEEHADDGEVGGDSSSDSGTGVREGDSVSDVDALPVLPPLQLPQSSGTIGVPEQCVSHLFAVYGFLRSFSTRLFLQPFTLDEFVGSLNCPVSNTLFDAIHVSLMRALRGHLETLSSESSNPALQCLRGYDWSLLDMLTWPVFVIQYLVVNGYTKGPEWKQFYDEVFNAEYYLLSVSRKLMILQILCDDVLECEELKAEMNMRKESEVGMDYDAEDIAPAETGPRKVHPRYSKTSFCEDKEAMNSVSASNAVNQPGNSTSYHGDTESTGGGDVDRNGDECRLCGMDGILLCCDGCPSAYHSRCIGVMKMFIPDGPWYCPECKISMTGPTIANGTSLRGAAIFGKDLYGQLFMGTCNHLLVLNVDNNEFCLRYYNQNDIPKVIQVLYKSMQHRPIYSGICTAVLQYWNIPENSLLLSASTETNINSADIKDDRSFSTPLLPSPSEDNYKPVSLAKVEYSPTTAGLIYNDNVVPSLVASSVIAQSPATESTCVASSKDCLTVNMKPPEETKMETIISASFGSYQSDMNYQNSVNMSTAVDPAKCSLVNGQFSNYGHADDMGLPLKFSLQTKETTQVGFGKCERNVTDGFGYMGLSYKPMSYINSYMHGDFAASAAAKFAIVSSEESRSEGRVSDSQRKIASAFTYLQAKAFSLTASRFFWPSSEKKLVEVPRERCGWCLSCKAPVSSKRGCMLNHAALSATKGAMKILAGFSSIRSGEGILPSIATYIIYMEECLRGLMVGPFQNASYRKHWRKQVEQATTFTAIKPLLLKLEENIRIIAFCGDWVKLIDEFPKVQSATSTLGTTQKRAPSGRHCKKRSSTDEATADGGRENSMWWRGGKFTKLIFQKATLPKSMVRKAARQGGSRKISGISYADGSEIPKRSRQLVWRVAVQTSRNASQMALQVRYLDFYLRWTDLIRPEQNIADGKGQETEASVFRNANICDKKLVEGKSCYGIAFGSQKHLPSRVMKNVVEIEKGPEGKEKYWFYESRIPLYLVKEYEEANEKVLFDKEHYNGTSQLHRRRLKSTCKDIFFYLACKRDNRVFVCSACQVAVSIRTAHKCNACQGYCHEACSISSLSATEAAEYLITCKQCYHAKSLAPKETNDESPNSPLLLHGRGNISGTVLKGPRTKAPDVKQVTPVTVSKGPKVKCHDQTLSSTRTKNSRTDKSQLTSDSISTAKSRRNNCSWGLIWSKKSNEDRDEEFMILLKGGSQYLKGGSSDTPNPEPVCHLCRKEYRSDLMYIWCKTCKNWYHAEAVELEESKIDLVLGFKCCKCRRIKSPVCPYSDSKPKAPYVKKSRTKASKKEHSGVDSDSGTFSDMREWDPATPIFPVENDPLLFSLSNVELITEPQAEADIEWNTVSVPGPQKLPVRRHVKHEGDGDGSFGGIHLPPEFSTPGEAGNLSKSADSILPAEYDPALHLESNLLNNSESVNNECMEFEPHTYFSLTELLLPDDSDQFEGVNVPADWSDYPEYFDTGVPEECGGVSSVVTSEPEFSIQDGIYSCCKCSQIEPAPDLCCEICGGFFHSHCSSWPESPSTIGWRCENCRQWQ